MTIIGDNVRLLEQLMAVKTEEAIHVAIQNFKIYHETPKEQRQFTLARDFKSFVRKIDIFSDPEALEGLLKNESRWFNESQRGHSAFAGKQKTYCPDPIPEQPLENGMVQLATEEQKEWARMAVLRDYVEHIDRGAREKGVTVEQLLQGYVEPLRKYRQFKTSIHQFEIAQRAV